MVWQGMAGYGKARQARQGEIRHDALWRIMAGMVSPGLVSCGAIWYGRQAEVRRVLVSSGASWQVW